MKRFEAHYKHITLNLSTMKASDA